MTAILRLQLTACMIMLRFPFVSRFRHGMASQWISADEEVATARGGGGGLALWKREELALQPEDEEA